MNEMTYQIVEMIVKLVAAALAAYVIPVISKAIRQSMAHSEIGKAVLAAQQTMWKASGAERKELAMKLAREGLDALHISMSDDQLSALIEAAVQEMHIDRGDYIGTDTGKEA